MKTKQKVASIAFAATLLVSMGARAEVTFEKKKTVFGGQPVILEIADNDEKREQGLMNRTSLSDTAGMLFIFDREESLSFWMKNTLIPLTIGYFDKKGKLFQILDMDPASPVELSPKLYVSAKPAKYALEMNKGWFKKFKVSVGTKLDLRSLNENK